jgi:hypothetical protein
LKIIYTTFVNMTRHKGGKPLIHKKILHTFFFFNRENNTYDLKIPIYALIFSKMSVLTNKDDVYLQVMPFFIVILNLINWVLIMWLSHNFLKEAIIKLKSTNHRYTNNDKKSILITHVHINHTFSYRQDYKIRKYKLILLDKMFNLRVSIVNLEVGHRFILEQSIGHIGKQRSTNRDLNSI